MTAFATLRRVLRAADAKPGHAGREPYVRTQPAPITPRTVDGWYNFHADAVHRAPRR